jgi:hypothetical protein
MEKEIALEDVQAGDHNSRRATPEEALSSFLSFANDPATMDEEELDAYLADAGFDFEAFSVRLSKDIERILAQLPHLHGRKSF